MSARVTVTVTGDPKGDLRQIMEEKLIDFHGGVVRKAPVDTGAFRASITLDLANLAVGTNCEYAEPLINGHSPQAPIGWWQGEIDRVFR